MDEHYLSTMAAHHALVQMSDNPRQFRGVSPPVRLMDQTFGAGVSNGWGTMARTSCGRRSRAPRRG